MHQLSQLSYTPSLHGPLLSCHMALKFLPSSLLKQIQWATAVRNININVPGMKQTVLKVKGCRDQVVCKWITLLTLTLLQDYRAISERGK